MKIRAVSATIIVAVLLSAGVLCAQREVVTKHITYLGLRKAVGKGFACSWVRTDASGTPLALGFKFNKAALSGLPLVDSEYQLALPSRGKVPPFDHLVLNWNVHGHVPEHIYDVPHFDFHFYMITPKERDGIVVTPQNMSRLDKYPPKEYLPKDYFFGPGSEFPRMGSHWIDKDTPEIHGIPFTETFIYGTYDGHVAFLEPMATVAFLNTNPKVDKPIKLPQSYEKPGYYPTRYTVLWDADREVYIVGLEGLVHRATLATR